MDHPGRNKEIRRYNMVLNLGTRVVNNYLISSDKGYILIDTG